MTTARERYEEKTKVVTFRVPREVHKELEAVKAKTGLSYGDLMRLGAGIAQEEMKAKLGENSGLEARLAELRASVEEEEGKLQAYLAEEKGRRLAELDTEMSAFRLFNRAWSTEEVSFKLGLPEAVVFSYLQEWG